MPPSVLQIIHRTNDFISRLHKTQKPGQGKAKAKGNAKPAPAAPPVAPAFAAEAPATQPEAEAAPVVPAVPPPPRPPVVDEPATLDEALARGLACKKCRPSKRHPVKGCIQCMGRFFDEIRQTK